MRFGTGDYIKDKDSGYILYIVDKDYSYYHCKYLKPPTKLHHSMHEVLYYKCIPMIDDRCELISEDEAMSWMI